MIRSYFHQIRSDCWDMIKRKYPMDKTKSEITWEFVEKSIGSCSPDERVVVLDTGCGHRSKVAPFPNVTYVGTDIVYDDVRHNRDVNLRFVSNLDRIPLKKESVDVIFSNMVMEHLRHPDEYFSQVHEILKPGGFLIFSTPCVYNIVSAINRLLPDGASRRLGKLLTEIDEEDIFPTYYRANSLGRIKRLSANHGFEEVEIRMFQPPPYAFVFSRAICNAVIAYYKIINRYAFLRSLRGVIVAKYRKR